MSFIRSSAASAPIVNGLDANAYIHSLPSVGARPSVKRLPMGSTNLMQQSAESGFAMLSVAGGCKPVTAKAPVPPPKNSALSTPHWTQRNACAAGSTAAQPAANRSVTVGNARARSVDASHNRATQLAPPAASVSASLTLTASHLSPIKQSLRGYQAEASRAKPETSKDVVDEMQRKAKARAESWKQKLLADAHSVRAAHARTLLSRPAAPSASRALALAA
jgi:hypothetical protein